MVMDYQALYRKYRPQRFDEVIGQDHVTKTLSREIVEEKIAHAYLFAGPRGTGKTTTARLLAKALNCTDLKENSEPCNICDSCVGVTGGHSLDVIELDAASHNKVEDIREIRMNVGTVAAVGGALRVYILDEAHMLSRAAGNALLKTLEEPPDHVVFVLATTEPYKMLDTIRSRSQRFDFHPLPGEVLTDYLGEISRREGFDPEHDALTMVASHARGSVRDALSLLEQAAALGAGRIEASAVARALGLADREAFATLAGAVAQQDAPAALGLVASLASQGADLRRFVSEALEFFRGVFLAQYAPNLEEIVDDPTETIEEWRRHAASLTPADVLRSIDQLAEALMDLRQGREERLVVELAVLRLTRPETVADPAALDARLSRVESSVRMLSSQASAQAASPALTAVPRPAPAPNPASEKAPPAAPPHNGDGTRESTNDGEPEVDQLERDAGGAPFQDGAATLDLREAVEEASHVAPPPELLVDLDLASFEAIWPALVARVRDEAGPRRHAWLKEATPVSAEAGKVVLEVPGHLTFHLEQLRADLELSEIVRSIATGLLDGGIDLTFVAGSGNGDAAIEEPTRAPDKDDMAKSDDGHDEDPTALVVEALGGEVVSE